MKLLVKISIAVLLVGSVFLLQSCCDIDAAKECVGDDVPCSAVAQCIADADCCEGDDNDDDVQEAKKLAEEACIKQEMPKDCKTCGGDGLCPVCSVGKRFSIDSLNCEACDPGTVQHKVGHQHFDCEACVAGRFQAKSGGVTCDACERGRYEYRSGSIECWKCDGGKYNEDSGSTSSSDCEDCASGKYSAEVGATTRATCQDCAAGSYADNPGSIVCKDCAKGKYSQTIGASEEIMCLRCDQGRFNDELGATDCKDCLPGTFSHHDFHPNGAETCSLCAEGKYTDIVAATTCISCERGRYSDEKGATQCKECLAGTYNELTGRTSSGDCKGCQKGRASNVIGASECAPCVPGRFSDIVGATECKLCQPGRWGDEEEAEVCKQCAKGKYSEISGATSSETCEDCQAGRYNDVTGASACKECLKGTYNDQVGSSDVSACKNCEQGKYTDFAGQAECKECDRGKYSDVEGIDSSDDCKNCELGRSSDQLGAAQCEECDEGYKGNETGLIYCYACRQGRFNNLKGQISCSLCEAGRWTDRLASVVCQGCEVGRFSNDTGAVSSASCMNCLSGSFSASEGTTACDLCEVAYFSNEGSTQCTECPAGKYSDQNGTAACSTCAPGSGITIPGQTACIRCQGYTEDLQPALTFTAPAGKSAGMFFYAFDSEQACEDASDTELKESDALTGDRELGSVAYVGMLAALGTTECLKIACDTTLHTNCKLKFIGKGKLNIGQTAQMAVVLGGPEAKNVCPATLRMEILAYGCEPGTVGDCLMLPTCILAGVVLLGLIVEFLLNLWVETVVEGRVEIELQRGGSTNDMIQEMFEKDLKNDIFKLLGMQQGIGSCCFRNKKKFKHFRAWIAAGDPSSSTCSIYAEFAVEVITNSSRASKAATRDAFDLEDFKLKLEQAKWEFTDKSGSTINKSKVKILPAGVVKARGSMFGLEIVATLEKLLPAPWRRNPEWDHLHKHVGKDLMHSMRNRWLVLWLWAQFLLNNIVALAVVWYAWDQYESCEEGYPVQAHGIWIIYLLVSTVWNMLCIHRYGGDRADMFFNRCFWNLLLRTFLSLCCITDTYQDTTFPLIAKNCGFDVWSVSLVLVIVGCGIMQFFVLFYLIVRAFVKYKFFADTPESIKRAHFEAVFLLGRAADNMPLCYALRPAMEEEFGGESSWAIKMVEARVPFFRFFFEDVEQGSSQVMFITYFSAANFRDKVAIGASICTSILATAFTVIQVLPVLRQWLWERFLASYTQYQIGRFLLLIALFTAYRVLITVPWIVACSNNVADETYGPYFGMSWTNFEAKESVVDEAKQAFIISILVFVFTALASEALKACAKYSSHGSKLHQMLNERTRENSEGKIKKRSIGIQECGDFEEYKEPWLETAREVYAQHSALKDISTDLDRALMEYARPEPKEKLGVVRESCVNLWNYCNALFRITSWFILDVVFAGPLPKRSKLPSKRVDVCDKLNSLHKDTILDRANIDTTKVDGFRKIGAMTYDGQWSKSEASGHGVLTIKDESGNGFEKTFEGGWKNNEADGRGSFKGKTYQYYGDWKAGNFHGRGKLEAADAPYRFYSGRFECGTFQGKGIYTEQAHQVKFLRTSENSETGAIAAHEPQETMILSMVIATTIKDTQLNEKVRSALAEMIQVSAPEVDSEEGHARIRETVETEVKDEQGCARISVSGTEETCEAVRILAKLGQGQGGSLRKIWSSVLQKLFTKAFEKDTLAAAFETRLGSLPGGSIKSISLMFLEDQRIPWELQLFGLDEECCEQWVRFTNCPKEDLDLSKEDGGNKQGIKVEALIQDGVVDKLNYHGTGLTLAKGDFIVAINGKTQKEAMHAEVKNGGPLALVVRRFEAVTPTRGVYEIVDDDWDDWDSQKRIPLRRGVFVNVLETQERKNGFISGRIQESDRTKSWTWIPLRHRMEGRIWARKVECCLPEARYRKLDDAAEKVHRIVSLRTRTQTLLRRPEFIYGGLAEKGELIDEATNLGWSREPRCTSIRASLPASLRRCLQNYLECFKVRSVRDGDVIREEKLQECMKRWKVKKAEGNKLSIQEVLPYRKSCCGAEDREKKEVDGDKAESFFWLINWKAIDFAGPKIPHFDDNVFKRDLFSAADAFKASKEKGRIAVAVFFSHPWLLPQEAKPDDEKNTKARKLVDFAKWYRDFCYSQTRKEIDVWFWIDYSCVDQKDPYPYMALLPVFITACDIILTWQTPDFDRRCWTCVERMLAYSFCATGMMPYSINEHFTYSEERLRHADVSAIAKEIEFASRLRLRRRWYMSKQKLPNQRFDPVWTPLPEKLHEQLVKKVEEIREDEKEVKGNVVKPKSSVNYSFDIDKYFFDLKAYLEGTAQQVNVVLTEGDCHSRWQFQERDDERKHIKDVGLHIWTGSSWANFDDDDVKEETELHDAYCKGKLETFTTEHKGHPQDICVYRKFTSWKDKHLEEEERKHIIMRHRHESTSSDSKEDKSNFKWLFRTGGAKSDGHPLEDDQNKELNRRFFSGYGNAEFKVNGKEYIVQFGVMEVIGRKKKDDPTISKVDWCKFDIESLANSGNKEEKVELFCKVEREEEKKKNEKKAIVKWTLGSTYKVVANDGVKCKKNEKKTMEKGALGRVVRIYQNGDVKLDVLNHGGEVEPERCSKLKKLCPSRKFRSEVGANLKILSALCCCRKYKKEDSYTENLLRISKDDMYEKLQAKPLREEWYHVIKRIDIDEHDNDKGDHKHLPVIQRDWLCEVVKVHEDGAEVKFYDFDYENERGRSRPSSKVSTSSTQSTARSSYDAFINDEAFKSMQALPVPQRRPRKLIYPLDKDSCAMTNVADLLYVQMLTDFALSVPANEIFKDRQSVEWGLSEVVEQSLISMESLGDPTQNALKVKGCCEWKLVDDADIDDSHAETEDKEWKLQKNQGDGENVNTKKGDKDKSPLIRVIDSKEVREIVAFNRTDQLESKQLVLVNYSSTSDLDKGNSQRELERESLKEFIMKMPDEESTTDAADDTRSDPSKFTDSKASNPSKLTDENSSSAPSKVLDLDLMIETEAQVEKLSKTLSLPLPLTIKNLETNAEQDGRGNENGAEETADAVETLDEILARTTVGTAAARDDILEKMADQRIIRCPNDNLDGMVLSNRGRVKKVKPGSSAAEQGIKEDWILIRADGEPKDTLVGVPIHPGSDIVFLEASTERVTAKLRNAMDFGVGDSEMEEIIKLARVCRVDERLIKKATTKRNELRKELEGWPNWENVDGKLEEARKKAKLKKEGKIEIIEKAKKYAQMSVDSLEKAMKLPGAEKDDKDGYPQRKATPDERRNAAEALEFSIAFANHLRVEVNPLLTQAKTRMCEIHLEDALAHQGMGQEKASNETEENEGSKIEEDLCRLRRKNSLDTTTTNETLGSARTGNATEAKKEKMQVGEMEKAAIKKASDYRMTHLPEYRRLDKLFILEEDEAEEQTEEDLKAKENNLETMSKFDQAVAIGDKVQVQDLIEAAKKEKGNEMHEKYIQEMEKTLKEMRDDTVEERDRKYRQGKYFDKQKTYHLPEFWTTATKAGDKPTPVPLENDHPEVIRQVEEFMNKRSQTQFKVTKLLRVEDAENFQKYFKYKENLKNRLETEKYHWPDGYKEVDHFNFPPWKHNPEGRRCSRDESPFMPLDDQLNEVYLWQAFPTLQEQETPFGKGYYLTESIMEAHLEPISDEMSKFQKIKWEELFEAVKFKDKSELSEAVKLKEGKTIRFGGRLLTPSNCLITSIEGGANIKDAGKSGQCPASMHVSLEADQFAKEAGNREHAVLLCRVALGKPFLIKRNYKMKGSDVRKKCLDRPDDEGKMWPPAFDSIIGDTGVSKDGTPTNNNTKGEDVDAYREFVVYRREQIFPEYVVQYKVKNDEKSVFKKVISL